jgi:hypothetical protein
LGSGFGQYGSTLNAGLCAAAGMTVHTNCRNKKTIEREWNMASDLSRGICWNMYK